MAPTWKDTLSIFQLQKCLPPAWASGGHGQTLWAYLLPSPSAPTAGSSETIALADGDHVVFHAFPGTLPVVLYLFHGLGGSTESSYMQRLARLGWSRGFHVIAANHRGCGSGRGLAAQPYHSGRGEDLAAVIQRGRELHPDKVHIAIGFSLSGNALLLLLAGYRGDHPPDLGIAVNAPIQLEKSALALHRGLARLYDLRFLRKCRRAVLERYNAGLISHSYSIPRWTTLHKFDNLYTAPACGFRDREDYYHSCSAKPLLRRIRIPTILLTSRDDPMVDCQDYLEAELSTEVHLHMEDHGGHMGYLSRTSTPLGNRRWLDYALDRYIHAWLVSKGIAGKDALISPLSDAC